MKTVLLLASILLIACSSPAAAPAKPEISRLSTRGLQAGTTTTLSIKGKWLDQASFFSTQTNVSIIVSGRTADSATLQVKVPALPTRGMVSLSVTNAGGAAAPVTLHLDNLPVVSAQSNQAVSRAPLPGSWWGVLDQPGESHRWEFQAKAGELIVFDVATKAIGSKADLGLVLMDAKERVIASNKTFSGADEPLLAHRFEKEGTYTILLRDQQLAGSTEHFYRVNAGTFPFVTGIHPLGARANEETTIHLIGYNLPATAHVQLKAGAPSKSGLQAEVVKTKPGRNVKSAPLQVISSVTRDGAAVSLDPARYRWRGNFRVFVSELPELTEAEPNDLPSQAIPLPVPAAVNGRLTLSGKNGNLPDSDLYRFRARRGETWIIETMAAQRGSPADTKLEVLHPDGRPVERLILQAVRDSYVNFRGVTSISPGLRLHNWEEMDLDQYIHLGGDVMKIFRMPQGPDSDVLFYNVGGKRLSYFDTTSIAHANDEPAFLVTPHPPGTPLVANGLPVFPVYYANDDDSLLQLGTDSRIHFTAPSDGEFLVRVSDSRGASGDRHTYRLVVRRAAPDFTVTLGGANPAISPGSGKEFVVSADRTDGFEGEIRVDIDSLPPGFVASSPLVIQAGHREAKGTIFAAADAPPVTDAASTMSKVTARATINGQEVVRPVNNLGKITLADKPRLYVSLSSDEAGQLRPAAAGLAKPAEITIAPGQTLPVWLKVKRNGHDDLITFTVEDLPHGIIVDNIGLNGVLIPKGQDERQIFLQAAKWVADMDRYCYAVENQAGRQTSTPILLRVRRGAAVAKAEK